MAIIPATQMARPNTQDFHGIGVLSWSPLANGDTGVPIQLPANSDRSIHIYGTFGAGGTLVVQVSNEIGAPTNWVTATDPSGAAISVTALALKAIIEVSRWIRVIVTAGDGTTSLTAAIIVRRTQVP